MKAVLLLNESAGRIRAEPHLADPAAWRLRMEAVGIDAEVCSGPAGQLAAAARRAAVGPADCVIAAGGDGTIHTAAEALAGTGKRLAVLPLGTLNHFARDLGMPNDVDEALRIIARGETRRVDVGEVNGRVFVNNSSIGIYSRMVLLRDAQRSRSRWGKFLAMVWAFFRVLRRFPRFKATIRVDGQPVHRTVPLILISNNPYQSGWPQLGRRSALDQGRLGVYVIGCSTRFGLLRCIFRALRHRLERIEDVATFLAVQTTIDTPRRHALVSMDGEVERLATPLIYRCRAGGLLVIAPPVASRPE